jgi:ABC-type transporter Mla subunit MlaD
MADEPENMVLKQLAALRGEMQQGFDNLTKKVDALDHKVGAMAQTLIGVQKDIRHLINSVGTLGAAVDEHTHRLDRIETRLNLHDA